MTCYRIDLPDGGVAFACTRERRKKPAPCLYCKAPHTKLCDGPRKDGAAGTCDRKLCDEHAERIGPDRDLCPDCAKHARQQRSPAVADRAHIPAAVGDRCVSWCPECNKGSAEDPSVLTGVKDRAGHRKRLRTRPVWREMDEDEQAMVRALGRCKFSVGSSDKRFARDLREQLAGSERRISVAQAAKLRRGVIAYRRQIPDPVVAVAKATLAHAERVAEQAALMWAYGHVFDPKKQEAIAARMVELDALLETRAPDHARLLGGDHG